MKWLALLSLTLVFAFVIFAIAGKNPPIVLSNDTSPFDLVSAMIGASALLITIVAILVAILSLIGYDNLKKAAVQQAEKHSEEIAKEVAAKVAEEVATDMATKIARDVSKYTTSKESLGEEYGKAYERVQGEDKND